MKRKYKVSYTISWWERYYPVHILPAVVVFFWKDQGIEIEIGFIKTRVSIKLLRTWCEK